MATFVFLDTETTGNGENDRVLQLAFIARRAGEKPLLASSLCKPPVPIDFFAMATHHITPETLANEPPFAETQAAKELTAVNKPDSIAVIHNAPFDLEMLRREGVNWQGGVIDTLRVARRVLDTPSHSLQYLRYALGLYREEEALASELGAKVVAHNAAGDAQTLYLLTQHLLKKIGGGKGEAVMELLRFTNEPLELKTLRFGKYRGKSFREVKESDIGYLRWLAESEAMKENPDADLVYTIRLVLES
ncbi:MAG: 3'-5' exonuclease [Helicobacteraceae bacterium]|jgi:DNA polymerase III epsilon subunit-like protein|nr:3'-5' exonuclease [Helicobacteraceae bacterium]